MVIHVRARTFIPLSWFSLCAFFPIVSHSLGDQWCPIIPTVIAKANRHRRMKRNKDKDLMRRGGVSFYASSLTYSWLVCWFLVWTGLIPSEPFIEPIVAFPKEYATLIKGSHLSRLRSKRVLPVLSYFSYLTAPCVSAMVLQKCMLPIHIMEPLNTFVSIAMLFSGTRNGFSAWAHTRKKRIVCSLCCRGGRVSLPRHRAFP